MKNVIMAAHSRLRHSLPNRQGWTGWRLSAVWMVMIGMAFSGLSCNKERSDCLVMPACIQAKINLYKENVMENPCSGYKVSEYRFKGASVYLFASPNCIADGQEIILNSNCDTICYLGGIAGIYTCEGLRFDSAATFVKTVWEP